VSDSTLFFILIHYRESGTFHPFDSRFSEYKFGHFKKKQIMTNIDFPKELSLDFAASLIPKRAMTSSYVSDDQDDGDDLYLGGQLDGSQEIGGGPGHEERSQGSNGSLSDHLLDGSGRPPLLRANTSLRLTRQKSMIGGVDLGMSSKSASNLLAPLDDLAAPSKVSSAHSPSKKVRTIAPTPSKAPKTPKTPKVQTSNSRDSYDDFDFDDDSDGSMMQKQQELKNIDFFRVCSLCELRLPRASVDMKVLRKHVVKLR
jgi:hypothetical protein